MIKILQLGIGCIKRYKLQKMMGDHHCGQLLYFFTKNDVPFFSVIGSGEEKASHKHYALGEYGLIYTPRQQVVHFSHE